MSTADRAPSFPFYAKDWLADPKVASLSFDNRGRYITLLAYMWEFSDAGCTIPITVAHNLVGKKFCACAVDAEMVAEYDYDGMAHLFSNRLSNEAQKLRSRSQAAKRSADIRWERERLNRGGDEAQQ